MTPSPAPSDADIKAAIDGKTKPLGALGRIEELAALIARAQGTISPRMERATLTIFAADHGAAADPGLSAYPQAVTRQMLLNFLAGGAAANVFARTLGVAVRVVDAGVAGEPVEHPDLISRRIGPGTASFMAGPAMTYDALERALDEGRRLGAEGDDDAALFGEMGIGNTSSAALVAAKLIDGPVRRLAGPGAGLSRLQLQRKRALLTEAASRTDRLLTAEEALAEYGGFEIAMMAGAMIGAAGAGRVVVVDGFIATAAACAAARMHPVLIHSLVHAHRSAEPGHALLLEAIAVRPLLDLDMRLGEGTGALLAWPLLRAAAAMLREMASFERAGVSGPA